MVVIAVANGDRRTLKDLLSSEVYESFDNAIRDREKQEQKTETRFVSIDKAELVGAETRDRAAQLTVRFVSQMISVTRDKAGTIVDGNPGKGADITDVWTFARDTTSRDPNWKLVGTGRAQRHASFAAIRRRVLRDRRRAGADSVRGDGRAFAVSCPHGAGAARRAAASAVSRSRMAAADYRQPVYDG